MFLLAVVLVACGGNNDNNNNDNNNNNNNNNEENVNDENNNNDNNNENNEDSGDTALELGETDLKMPYVAWAREEISTHLLAAILEDVGYNVELSQVEAGPMFTSVADGDSDFHTSAWLPATHKEYWDKYGDDLVKVNEVLDKAPLALTVPSYMEDVNSIEDLIGNEELGESVNWTIIGIDGGAGIMSSTEEALEEYEGFGDDWELTPSSEAAMLTELQEAIENEEPIVVPLWKPHWIFGVEDLKMLDDPKEIYGGEGDQIYTVARKGLEEDSPAAYRVLEQYDETYEMVEELMPLVHDEGQDVEDVVQDFLDDNPDLLERWTEGVN